MPLLPKSEFAKLHKIIERAEFDSEAALELDGAIMKSLPDDVEYETLEPLDDAQAAFFVCWWLEGEVNNGGFDQFFLNKGPLIAREALKFCKLHGLKSVADILERAIREIDPAAMADGDALSEWLADEDNNSMERFDPLDSEFFALDPYPPFLAARLKYVHENPSSFFK